MASAAQIEAFAWWLSQAPENRRSRHLREKFGIAENTAAKWLAQFNSELARVANEAKEVHLREFRTEYESLQLRSMSALPVAMDAVEHNLSCINESKQKGELVDPDLIGKTLNALKAVYSLAESASGADVAKKRASQKPVSAGKGDGKMALPDLGAFFLADSVEIEDESPLIASLENGSINDSGNENPVDPAAMPEK